MYWGYNALLINQFRGVVVDCDGDVLQYGADCPVPGEAVLQSRGLTPHDNVATCIGALWALTITQRVVAYLLLRFKKT
jgi:hypothetical protein